MLAVPDCENQAQHSRTPCTDRTRQKTGRTLKCDRQRAKQHHTCIALCADQHTPSRRSAPTTNTVVIFPGLLPVLLGPLRGFCKLRRFFEDAGVSTSNICSRPVGMQPAADDPADEVCLACAGGALHEVDPQVLAFGVVECLGHVLASDGDVGLQESFGLWWAAAPNSLHLPTACVAIPCYSIRTDTIDEAACEGSGHGLLFRTPLRTRLILCGPPFRPPLSLESYREGCTSDNKHCRFRTRREEIVKQFSPSTGSSDGMRGV